jgi:beta-lactamase regulating signal transducer with metallopeptidase domain
MTSPALFSGQFFSALGWALFHFLWQGALVAGGLAVLEWLLRKSTPAVRYALACGALATMLALPVVTAWSLTVRPHRPAFPQSPRAATHLGEGVSVSPALERGVSLGGSLIPASLRDRLETLRPWALTAWFAGVLFLSVRFLGGLAAARRLTRRGTRPAPFVWQEKLAQIASRLAIPRPVTLLESAVVRVPTAIGALRPVILFPASVFLGLPTQGLEALIAHELAHVRRHDYLANLLQTVAETLLFYHPAVWWVSARVRAEREQCCDDLAIAATGDARTYARALMRLEEMRGSAPALAVAAGGGNLWRRVLRVLTQSPAVVERPSGWLAAAVVFAMILVLGAAARVRPAEAWGEERRTEAGVSVEAGVPDAVVGPEDRTAQASTESDSPSLEHNEQSSIAADPVIEEASPQDTEAPEPPSPAAEEVHSSALTADELVLLGDRGVTADYVRSIAALGYDRADLDDLVALKTHGVMPEDIAEMNRIFGKRPLDEHVAFKIHGVTPDEVRRLSALGLGRLSPDDVVSMKIHGVDAAYVEKLRSAGHRQLSAEEVVSARIHGVAPEDAVEWRRLGYANASLEDLISARIHGAGPKFASEVRALGFSNLPLDDLVAFRIHGVTADFLREMKSLGFAPPAFSSDDAVAFRIHGVTPEFVREIRGLGYSAISAYDLVALRIHGISAQQIRRENSRAGRQLPLEEHAERHDCGKESDDEK